MRPLAQIGVWFKFGHICKIASKNIISSLRDVSLGSKYEGVEFFLKVH